MKYRFRRMFFLASKQISKYNRCLKPLSKAKVVSIEAYSYYASKYVVEDIRHFIKWGARRLPRRYTDEILRNLCEQIIEYKYVCKNPERIKEYFGDNIDISSDDDVIVAYKKVLGERRMSGMRKVAKKAENIGALKDEESTVGDTLSLYRIYEITSTKYHHSYYNQIIKDTVNRTIIDRIVDILDSRVEDDVDYMMLIYLMSAFMSSYIGVAKKAIRTQTCRV